MVNFLPPVRMRNDEARRGLERGYGLLMVCFLAAVMVIATAAAVPSILTEGRRVKEAEMIWRGEQYARAVKLYYRKYGRFPQSFEDLTEPKGQIRFLRKAYAEPMNRKDGSWRLIYVGPNGQLIGSVKTINVFGRPGGIGGTIPAAAPQRPLLDDRPGSEQRPPDPLPPEAGQRPESPPTPPPSEAKSPGPEGRVFGGNIIGVASKIERESIRMYKGASTYKEWEFIWDPAAEGQMIGPAGSRPQVPPGKAPTGITPPRQ